MSSHECAFATVTKMLGKNVQPMSVNSEKDKDETDIYKPIAGMVHWYIRRNCAKQAGGQG
jgi:hypothetical protein